MQNTMRIVDKQDYESEIDGYTEVELVRMGGVDARKFLNGAGAALFVIDGSSDNLLIIS
jgi:hypothetical protein